MTTRRDARARLARVLGVTVIIVFVLGVVAALVPGAIGRAAGWSIVALLIAVPIGRVLWLQASWDGPDRRFTRAAFGLLGVLGIGATLSVLLPS